MTDGYRPPISDWMKHKVAEAFAIVPENRSGALVAIVDENGARLHIAHKFNDHWKVGGAVGKPFDGKWEGYCAVEVSW